MAQRIYGTIRDGFHGGIPIKGLRIMAWDEDWPGGDDFLGDDITNKNGDFEISYPDIFWDSSMLGITSSAPDIYISIDIKNKSGRWVRIGRSQIFHDHDLSRDLKIDLSVNIEEPIEKMTKFDPQVHGFRFINNFKFNPLDVGLDFKELGMGFCGGMCGAALNRFKAGLPISDVVDPPRQDSLLYRELSKRQIKSMGAGVILKMFKFQSAPDQVDAFRKASIGELTKGEWPKVKAELDRDRPIILVLVRVKKLFGNPTKNHQVLAVGYKFDPTRQDLTIYEYDPNQKNNMMTLELNLGLPDGKLYLKDQAYRGTRGFFVSDAASAASRKMKF